MSDTILNVNNEMNHMQELITEVDHCRNIVNEITSNSKLYKTNEKINIITIVVTLYQIAAAILRYNKPVLYIGIGLALAAAVVLILDKSLMAYTDLVFIIAMIAIRYLRLRVFLSLAGIVSLVIMLVRGYDVNKTGVCMIFLFTLLTVADIIQRASRKEGDTEPQKHLAAVSVFMVIPFIIFLAVSVPDKP